ncbi:hypothetical protein FACS1894208_09040 [Clostridia bacterium]|nr:hypothetical protein FACS1894208_09040 [Clostridia bacterium]
MKTLPLALALIFLVTLAAAGAFVAPANAADAFDHGIEYVNPVDSTVYRVPGSAVGYYIDLAAEKLFAPSGATIAGLYDGKKWTRVSVPAEGLDISRLLNKGGTFKLADKLNERGNRRA